MDYCEFKMSPSLLVGFLLVECGVEPCDEIFAVCKSIVPGDTFKFNLFPVNRRPIAEVRHIIVFFPFAPADDDLLETHSVL